MNVTGTEIVQVPIETIEIGQRRREKLTKIKLLANSIAEHGLIHPILLRGNQLVAGHRRLEACKSLNWKRIPARQVQRMSDEQLRAIELDENTARENLSDYATSKARLAQIRQAEADLKAEATAASVSDRAGQKPRRNGRPPEADSRTAVAAKSGISRADQVRTERHVSVAERYPFMQRTGWQRHHVLDAADQLERIPEPDRSPLAALLDQPALPARDVISYLANAAEMSQAQRRDVIARGQSPDPFVRENAVSTLAQIPASPDPGLIVLATAARELQKAAQVCRSARYRQPIAELSASAEALRAQFSAHEKEARNEPEETH